MKIAGHWDISGFGDAIPGELNIDEQARSVVLSFKAKLQWSSVREFPQDMRQDVLYGMSVYETPIVLVDCFVRFIKFYNDGQYEMGEGVVEATYALEGSGIDQSKGLLYNNVEVDFGEIGEWARICSFVSTQEKSSCGVNYSYKWNSIQQAELPLFDGKVVCFFAGASFPGTPTWTKELVLRQDIKVAMVYPKPVAFQEIAKDVRRIREIISLATGKRMGVIGAAVSFWSSNPFNSSGTPKARRCTLKVHVGNHIVPHVSIPDTLDYLFTLPELASVARREKDWGLRFDKLQPSIELYLSPIVFDEKNIRVKFLSLMQAIELLHALTFGNDAANIVDRLKVTISFDGADDEAIMKFLFGPNGKCNRPDAGLKLRLFDLLYRKSGWPQEFPFGLDIYSFVDKLKNTRNYYTHYNPIDKGKAFAEDNLLIVIRFMTSIFKYHILKALGFSEQFALARMDYDVTGLVRLHNTPANKDEWDAPSNCAIVECKESQVATNCVKDVHEKRETMEADPKQTKSDR